MKIRNHRRLFIIGFLLLFPLLILFINNRLQIPTLQPDIECHEEAVTTMSIQQVSNLFDIPLVELRWLPSNLQAVPEVSTYPVFVQGHPELSECEIVIDYPHPNRTSLRSLISIRSNSFGYLEATKSPTSCSWHFTTSGPTGSDCNLELDGISSTIRLYIDISPEFDPETILQILDGIVVVEPQNSSSDED
jgi:hypothetical protein